MTINNRIKKIKENLCDNSTKDFASKLNVSSQAVSNYTRNGYNIGREVIENIKTTFPIIDANWLLTGKGDMIMGDTTNTNNGNGQQIIANNIQGGISADNHQYYSDLPDILRAQIDDKDRLLAEKEVRIKEKDAQIKEKDAQINKLLDILHKQ